MNYDCCEDEIDLYEDLDKVELEIEESEPIDTSQNPFVLSQVNHELEYSYTNGLNTVTDNHEQTSNDLELYSELLYSDIKNKHEKERKDKEEFNRIRKENADLKQSQQLLETKVERLAAENDILKRNISSLYKTAKDEITFKTELVVELRNELDEYIFRRRARPHYRPNKQSFKDSRYNKSHEMVECDTTTEQESKEKKLGGGSKPFDHDFSHEIANNDSAVTKKSSKDIYEVKNNNKDTFMDHAQLKDIEYVLETVFHKFANNEDETLKQGKSMFGETQEGLMENLKKIVLLAMGKNSGDVASVNSNAYIVKGDCRKGMQQGASYAEAFSGKRHNDEVAHQPLLKKRHVSSHEKTLFQQLLHVQSYGDSKNIPEKLPEKFSSSQKKDVFKLYNYQNMDVPYVVKRRLGILLTKNSSNTTIPNLSSKLKPTSLKQLPNKVGTVKLTDSVPKICVINSQSDPKNVQKLDVSPNSKLTLSKESDNACMIKPTRLDSSETNLINRPSNFETDSSCKITNLETSVIVCNRALPIIISSPEKVHKENKIQKNSEEKSKIDFSDILDFGLKILDDANPKNGTIEKTSNLLSSLHKRDFKLTDNSSKQVCTPAKELCMSMKQSAEKKSDIDFKDILDFGLKMLDDPSSKRRNRIKTKKSSSASLLRKTEFKLTSTSTEQVCTPSKELNVSVKLNAGGKDEKNFDSILDFGLKMLDDPFEKINV